MAQQRPCGIGDRRFATDPFSDVAAIALCRESEKFGRFAAGEGAAAQHFLDLRSGRRRPMFCRLQALGPDIEVIVVAHGWVSHGIKPPRPDGRGGYNAPPALDDPGGGLPALHRNAPTLRYGSALSPRRRVGPRAPRSGRDGAREPRPDIDADSWQG